MGSGLHPRGECALGVDIIREEVIIIQPPFSLEVTGTNPLQIYDIAFLEQRIV